MATRRTSNVVVADDLETRATARDQLDLRLWLRMMTVHKLINSESRRRLRTTFNMSLARFDLMAQLDRNPDGIRMGELSSRLMVTTGNITALTDEVEAEGLVERLTDPRSRRASLVRLTAKGKKTFRQPAKALENWIVDFFSGLSESDKKFLFQVLGEHKRFVMGSIQKSAPDLKLRTLKRASMS